MSDLDTIKKVISFVSAADGNVSIENPVVLHGMLNFAEYIIDELEVQNEDSFDEVTEEDFNKLSVAMFDSGLVLSVVGAEASESEIKLEFCFVDTWDEAENETTIYADMRVNLASGRVSLEAQVDSEDESKDLDTIASILYVLGIQQEDSKMIIPDAEDQLDRCTKVVKERILYLIGEGLIQFGTRYRKMLDPETMQVAESGKGFAMPEFPGESSVILFGLFLVAEASEINSELMDEPEDTDIDDEEYTEVAFSVFDNRVDERPVEERLAEAIKEASNNKTLH